MSGSGSQKCEPGVPRETPQTPLNELEIGALRDFAHGGPVGPGPHIRRFVQKLLAERLGETPQTEREEDEADAFTGSVWRNGVTLTVGDVLDHLSVLRRDIELTVLMIPDDGEGEPEELASVCEMTANGDDRVAFHVLASDVRQTLESSALVGRSPEPIPEQQPAEGVSLGEPPQPGTEDVEELQRLREVLTELINMGSDERERAIADMRMAAWDEMPLQTFAVESPPAAPPAIPNCKCCGYRAQMVHAVNKGHMVECARPNECGHHSRWCDTPEAALVDWSGDRGAAPPADTLGEIGVLLLEFAEADHRFDHPEETDEVAVLAERWERALDPIRQVAYRIRQSVQTKTRAQCIADLANALRLTPEEEEMGQ